jgi:hypothetical protein
VALDLAYVVEIDALDLVDTIDHIDTLHFLICLILMISLTLLIWFSRVSRASGNHSRSRGADVEKQIRD